MSLSLSIFFGHVMSSHHSEQMSQRSQVSRIALNCLCICICLCHFLFFGRVIGPEIEVFQSGPME